MSSRMWARGLVGLCSLVICVAAVSAGEEAGRGAQESRAAEKGRGSQETAGPGRKARRRPAAGRGDGRDDEE